MSIQVIVTWCLVLKTRLSLVNFLLGLMQESGFHVPEIMAEEYKAIENYKADGPGQVSFEEGDIIHVLDKLEDGKPVGNIIKLYPTTKSNPDWSNHGLS